MPAHIHPRKFGRRKEKIPSRDVTYSISKGPTTVTAKVLKTGAGRILKTVKTTKFPKQATCKESPATASARTSVWVPRPNSGEKEGKN
jgi:hypothetical protein